jgi:Asp-tRNA(Asn)/Glu-tRNA(Gln) amidotransferase A subunit family amidase
LKKIQAIEEETTSDKKPGETDAKGMGRRTFVGLLPSAGAALAFPNEESGARPVPTQTAEGRVTDGMLQQAKGMLGLEWTPEQDAQVLPGLNRNLTSYEALRAIPIPLDTEPAIAFHPGPPSLPAGGPARRVTRRKASRRTASLPPFRSVEELAFSSVGELGELLRQRKVTSVQLTQMYLDRLKRYGEKLLCMVTLTEELALQQAAAADRELQAGRSRGPLHGIPYGVKDLFATRGYPTTWGAEPFQTQQIDQDATVVERLHEAGAVLVAKLSMGALAQGGRWFRGMTRNPWQPEETRIGSSGSSAGSASATSAGLVGFAIGTETLGSIISPSARCGVVGLRPTYGRISRHGAMGLSWTMDKIGPICRRVEDCALVLETLIGPDGRDRTVTDAPFSWNPARSLQNLRVGFVAGEFEQGEEARQALYREALDALRGAGVTLHPVKLPTYDAQALRIILSAEAAAAFDDITRDGRVNQLSGQGPGDWPTSFRTARFIPAVEYLRAQRGRTLLMQEMERWMAPWDVFVTPAPGSRSLTITNLTGHPAVGVPCGFLQGLPQSIMFTGRLYDEATPLRVALAFEEATRWHHLHPPLE